MRSQGAHSPVLRLETNVLYTSMTDASKAMGRHAGYVSEHLINGLACYDTEGNVWTFQQLPSGVVKAVRTTTRCVIDEIPDCVFHNVADASRAIGRWPGYIKEKLSKGRPIKDKSGRVVHFRYLDNDGSGSEISYIDIDWYPIPNYPDYKISKQGQIFSCKSNKIMKLGDSNSVELSNEEGRSGWTAQALMACTFLGYDVASSHRPKVLFKDDNPKNLNLDNLYIKSSSDIEGEIWVHLTNYNDHTLPSYYYISNKGRLKSAEHVSKTLWKGKYIDRHFPSTIFKPACTPEGYLQCSAYCEDGRHIMINIHKAVATAFCKNDDPDNKVFINHIDGNKQNNDAENLEWCTPRENTLHAFAHGLTTLPGPRIPIRRLETGEIYDSLSSTCKAMGRWNGYIGECIKYNRVCKDVSGDIWTLEVAEDALEQTQSDYRKRVNNAISESKKPSQRQKQLFAIN